MRRRHAAPRGSVRYARWRTRDARIIASQALRRTGEAIRGWITDATLPEALQAEVLEAYRQLAQADAEKAVAAGRDPWRDWGAAALFVASMQDRSLAGLLAVLRWWPDDEDVDVDAAVARAREQFRSRLAEAHACVSDSAALDQGLRVLRDPLGCLNARLATAPSLRARFLAAAGCDDSEAAFVALEAELLRAPRRIACADTVHVVLVSCKRVVVTVKQAEGAEPHSVVVSLGIFRHLQARPQRRLSQRVTPGAAHARGASTCVRRQRQKDEARHSRGSGSDANVTASEMMSCARASLRVLLMAARGGNRAARATEQGGARVTATAVVFRFGRAVLLYARWLYTRSFRVVPSLALAALAGDAGVEEDASERDRGADGVDGAHRRAEEEHG
jgi:hypothetical protein